MRGLAAGIGALLAAAVAATPAQALPELRISMPSAPYPAQVAPVYVDAFQQPGRVLYRFEAVIHNDGTTLDLYREPDGAVRQALWGPGEPTAEQSPGERPAGVASAPAGPGARMDFVVEETHAHFHFFTAARYELEVPGGPPRVSDKVGFCMFDSFDIPGGAAAWFQPDRPWCHEAHDEPGLVRMGLSPGAADRYTSQREFQYVDVTGLAPGPYRLHGIANPSGHVLEADGTPAVTSQDRTVPGVLAEAATAVTAQGASVEIAVQARHVAPEVPARRSATCVPRATVGDCYARVTPDSPLRFAVASAPRHGSASFDGGRLTYAPEPAFTGTDRIAYTATDARGLVSAPAAIDVFVRAQPPEPGPSGERRLLRIGRVRRTGRRTLAVRLLCRPAAVGACAGRVEARIGGRRVGRRRFAGLAAGRRRTVMLRLRRPPARRAVVLQAVVSDALGAGATARRTLASPRPR